jgi:DNA repair exonuclease SbcCD ATPase subunit
MIILKNITLRNFLSIGQVTQAVNFDRQELTLILGENLDLGGDGARNGTGKTSLIQALSYALFGVPINSIRKDNLVNRTNGKNMMVTLEFSVNSIDYKIERGRKPNILRFYVNSDLQKGNDDAQGENKETQSAIEKVIHMSADMFRHIVALNTYSEPFLALKNNEQRDIIEQLLGITLLSEKAESIKQQLKNTKDDIQQEEFNVKAIEEANKRVKEQIESTKRRQKLWKMKHDEDLERLAIDYQRLITINIDSELQAHKDLSVWNEKKKQQDAYNALIARSTAWQQKHDSDISVARVSYSLKNEYDIETELEAWTKLNEWTRESITQDTLASTIATQTKSIEKEKKLISKLEKEVRSLEDHTCYACGQDFHDESHAKVLTDKQEMLTNTRLQVSELANLLVANALLVKELGLQPTPLYKTEAEAIRHSSDLSNLKKVFEDKKLEANPFADQLAEYTMIELGRQPETHYDTESQAIEHRSKVANIIKDIERKSEDVDPYNEQIAEMENQALQEINFDKINRLTRTMEHQKFLLDILTSKDSFVRKKIIDQNLSYLNSRLTHYLDKIGLPHQVIFKNDLQVEITELGREMDFYNLSRGEMNRVILALSWAFRDVWENLYSPINLLFIDELLDNGTDGVGVENSIAILKDMTRRRHKSIWLVSHKEELVNRVPNVLRVVKEHGFTTYDTSVNIE